jgi:hypothetical protein
MLIFGLREDLSGIASNLLSGLYCSVELSGFADEI